MAQEANAGASKGDRKIGNHGRNLHQTPIELAGYRAWCPGLKGR
jgi:hypothetical protein